MPTEKHAEKLDTLVTTVASRLTPVDAVSFVPVAKLVLQDLVEHFEVDTCFLRFNDHELGATVLVAEYPRARTSPNRTRSGWCTSRMRIRCSR